MDRMERCPFVITREMEEARSRLEAYKNKVQPYPAYPDERAISFETTTSAEKPIPDSPWSRDQWQSVQLLRAQVNYLNNKVTEMRAEKQKQKETLKKTEGKPHFKGTI